ncbi:hypothetical protein RchiOBHm_Chr7g0225661 [Rosa chinensis]|uniref:Uncharacterized protein n=1 Tax=Rosa chinensis TaxID=74649 RepID=A0A2P6PE59_ROSCH|nr:hypothetical protein RchiOBHm_Chr7g0225661 [Rosa chinensis]
MFQLVFSTHCKCSIFHIILQHFMPLQIAANSSDQTKDQDLLSHPLKSLANLASTVDGRNISALLQASQGLPNTGSSIKTAQQVPDTVSNIFEPGRLSVSASSMDDCVIIEEPLRPIGQRPILLASDMQKRRSSVDGDLGSQITSACTIIDWLSHSPTEIESYIRPGCIILTIYLRLEKSTWEEVCFCYDVGMLLCALEGKYMAQEACDDMMDGADTTVEHDELQCIRFSWSIPNVTGRGFIEIC